MTDNSILSPNCNIPVDQINYLNSVSMQVNVEYENFSDEVDTKIISEVNGRQSVDCQSENQIDVINEMVFEENQSKSDVTNLGNIENEQSDLKSQETLEVNVISDKKEIFRINWLSTSNLLSKAENVYKKPDNNFLRGCFWSPDGTCLLTNSNDNVLRIFELPKSTYEQNASFNECPIIDMTPVLKMREMDLIYDTCWYPYMNSNNPDSCFLASTSRKNAVILWDAYSGKERARVQPRDHLDEPSSARSLAFSRDGVKLYCGFDKCVRVYDITRLSDNPVRRPRIGKKSDFRGIISCISTSAVNIGMYGCGSYSKDAAIFHESSGEEIIEFLRADDRVGGITHLEFSPTDMNCVVTGSRIDDALHVWDLRNPGSPLYATAKRNVKTNQRIYFSFDPTGNYIMTGNHDGSVSAFSINGGHIVVEGEYILPKIAEWSAHKDVCNGLSLHPYLPLLATCSGQRRVRPPWRREGMLNTVLNSGDDSDDWSTDEDIDVMFGVDENQLKIWSFPVISEFINSID